MSRYEAVYNPGEDDRLPEWLVVEWTVTPTGRIGRTVENCGYSAEAEETAHDIAFILNRGAELEAYAEFG